VQPGRDSDHSLPSSAEVENKQELYNSSPPRAFMACGGTALPFIHQRVRNELYSLEKMETWRMYTKFYSEHLKENNYLEQ
jgi:hypothetical protein